jgi:thiol-disulfide isomerase/thioredoxin
MVAVAREVVVGRRRWFAPLVFGVAALMAALGGAAAFWWLYAPVPGHDVPVLSLSLPDVDGRNQALEQFRGKVVVVNFWATWCAPCREEIPDFIRLQDEWGAQGLQFVGIAIDEPEKVRQFSAEFAVNYPMLIGGYGAIELSRALGNKLGALPFTTVIDREGRVVHVRLGAIKPEQLRSISRRLL